MQVVGYIDLDAKDLILLFFFYIFFHKNKWLKKEEVRRETIYYLCEECDRGLCEPLSRNIPHKKFLEKIKSYYVIVIVNSLCDV